MARSRIVKLEMPIGGVDRSMALRRQGPFTTPSALNVWPIDYDDQTYSTSEQVPARNDGRARLSIRPGRVSAGFTSLNGALSSRPAAWSDNMGSYIGLCTTDGNDASLISSSGSLKANVNHTGSDDRADACTGLDRLFSTCFGATTIGVAYFDGTADTDIVTEIDADPGTYNGIHPPLGAGACCMHQQRLFLANIEDSRHQFACSATGDYLQWDSSSNGLDASVESKVLDNIRTLIPHNEQQLLICCDDSIYMLNGNPVSGQLYTLSNFISPLSNSSWCYSPFGTFMMTRDGLYLLRNGSGQQPEPISRGKIPGEFLGLQPYGDNPDDRFGMAYDSYFQGLHLVVRRGSSSSEYANFFFHWPTQSFWPQEPKEDVFVADIPGSRDDASTVIFDQTTGNNERYVISGDGNDSFDAYCWIGPIRLGGDGMAGEIIEVSAILGDSSQLTGTNKLGWEVYIGDSPTQAFNSTAAYTGRGWDKESLNFFENPMLRGAYAFIKVGTSGNRNAHRWSLESVQLRIAEAGPEKAI